MLCSIVLQHNGECYKRKKAFKLTYSVSTDINAPVEKVWQILINADGYASWNSKVKSLEGRIALGEQIKLVSTIDTNRIFKLKVKQLEENNVMVWVSGAAPMFRGIRTYKLTLNSDGTVKYTMT